MDRLSGTKKVLCCLALVIAAAVTGLFYRVETTRRLTAIVVFLLIVTAVSGMIVYKKKGRYALYFLMVFAFIIKAEYIIYTPTWLRQHDVIGFGAGFGQAGFIEYFAEKIRLIDFDPRSLWGFFQPPLHHMLAGLWLRGWSQARGVLGISYDQCCEAVQCLTLIYSCLITVFAYKILKLLDIKGKALFVGTAFAALHPCFIQMSGSINNDILCVLFILVSMYFFILWLNEERGKSLILSGLFLGLAMMTKLSAILLAPAIGILMLLKLWNYIKEKKKIRDIRSLLLLYLGFGAVSVPLGCFFPVRNLLLFGVPLNYTPPVGEPLDKVTLFQRFFDFKGAANPFTNMIANGNDFDEYNIFLAILKTSIFGEADFSKTSSVSTIVGCLLLLSGALLSIIIFVLFAAMFIKNIKGRFAGKAAKRELFMLLIMLTGFGFLLNLCLSIPNFSSQDFRYIAHLIVPEAYLIAGALYIDDRSKESKGVILAKKMLCALAVVFLLLSVIMYLLAGMVVWN